MGGVVWGNPGDLACELGRGVAGEALEVAGVWFGCSHAAETMPTGGHNGGQWRAPLEVLLRRAWSLAWATHECGSSKWY
jgi:hypothetical protein